MCVVLHLYPVEDYTVRCPTKTKGPDIFATFRSVCNSNTSCFNVLGAGPGPLQPRPARSYAHALTCLAKRLCTPVQSFEKAPPPASKMTTGFASRGPVQLMCSLWPPTSI